MRDIVERLRAAATRVEAEPGIWAGDVSVAAMRDAAAEIERLRRHADVASGLVSVPVHARGAVWHVEAEGVLRLLAQEAWPEGTA